MAYFKHLLLLLILVKSYSFHAQTDTVPQVLTKDNLYCVFVIDKIWTDPRSAAKRSAIGPVNFIQIENGFLSAVGKTPKEAYLFAGTVDSLETDILDSIPILRIYATTNNYNVQNFPYIFEFQQSNENVIIHSRKRRTQTNHYFLVHAASDEELEEIRAYIKENEPKY